MSFSDRLSLRAYLAIAGALVATEARVPHLLSPEACGTCGGQPALRHGGRTKSTLEMLENTDAVINRDPAATISLQYQADSVVNSGLATGGLAAIPGFWLAHRLGRGAVALALLMEVANAISIRDNLPLNIVMLIHPFGWIKAWQLAASP
jgi:hypothetical protein